jgi:hypothetical protein
VRPYRRAVAAGGEHAGHGHLLLAEPHQAVEGAASAPART